MNYSYYPGCSLERNAIAYHESLMAIMPCLGLEFNEIDDWNCCGATEFMTVDKMAAVALSGRNLALAAGQASNGTVQLVAPCSACYLNLKKTDKDLAESPELSTKINTALAEAGLNYVPGTVQTRHLLHVLVNDVGLESISDKVTNPLYGLRLAPYYGCMIVRPEFEDVKEDTEFPTSLDELLTTLSANVVDFPAKTNCCGGHMTQISEPTALELIRRVLAAAEREKADAVVVLCPMCQLNLDAYQGRVNRYFGTDFNIPILYFTQLMGLAFGLSPDDLGFGTEFVETKHMVGKIMGTPPKKPRKKKRVSKEALPMPMKPSGIES